MEFHSYVTNVRLAVLISFLKLFFSLQSNGFATLEVKCISSFCERGAFKDVYVF